MTKKEISKEQLVEFCESPIFDGIIQKNHEKYKKRWLKWAGKKAKIKLGTTVSWNWAGLFLGEFWLFYRKMYFMASFIVFLRALIVVLPLFFPQMNNVLSFLSVMLNLIVATYSYDWYLTKTYTMYITSKDSDDQSLQNAKEYFEQQGGVSLKSTIIYLAVLIISIAASVLYLMDESLANSSSHSKSTSQDVYSEQIQSVRSGVFAIDESIYLANALESYPLFTSYTWEELTSSQGRHIVRFIAEYDMPKEMLAHAVELNSKKVSQVRVIFDFAMNVNDGSFSLYSVQILVDNTPMLVKGSATQKYALELLTKIYQSQYLNVKYLADWLSVKIVHDLPNK